MGGPSSLEIGRVADLGYVGVGGKEACSDLDRRGCPLLATTFSPIL